MPGNDRKAAKPMTNANKLLWTKTIIANNQSFELSSCSPIAKPSNIEWACKRLQTGVGKNFR